MNKNKIVIEEAGRNDKINKSDTVKGWVSKSDYQEKSSF